ncbi:MAG: redox-sensing transcriptional repressor Rex [Actinomycetia bacterium]|nr:redox-sensing transcriptional repressor Rex [Actinomycetes bacterium]
MTDRADAGRDLGVRRGGVPEATVGRLPLYHRVLVDLADAGVDTVSSDALAATAGVSPAKLRKDLSFLGSYGTRGVGYEVSVLIEQIGAELGISSEWPVVIVGVGHLGHALANYGGFTSRGFRLVALFDEDPELVGTDVAGLVIRPFTDLPSVARAEGVTIGVVATPAAAAQDVADALVAAGVNSVLNFAPVVLTVPPSVDVRRVDLASELQILAFHQQRRGDELGQVAR